MLTGNNMSSAWGCPHEVDGQCMKVKHRPCNPGMKGCVLYGRFAFSVAEKNSPSIKRKLEQRNRKNTDANKPD
jgi:hypothetical protein